MKHQALLGTATSGCPCSSNAGLNGDDQWVAKLFETAKNIDWKSMVQKVKCWGASFNPQQAQQMIAGVNAAAERLAKAGAGKDKLIGHYQKTIDNRNYHMGRAKSQCTKDSYQLVIDYCVQMIRGLKTPFDGGFSTPVGSSNLPDTNAVAIDRSNAVTTASIGGFDLGFLQKAKPILFGGVAMGMLVWMFKNNSSKSSLKGVQGEV